MISVEDQREIEAVLLRYATAADTRDQRLLESCFADSVRADYGAQIGGFDTRDALVGGLTAMLAACGPTLHFITNIVITEAADDVRTRSYTHAVVYVPGAEAPLRTAGTYDDRFVHTSNGWRIAERIYTSIA